MAPLHENKVVGINVVQCKTVLRFRDFFHKIKYVSKTKLNIILL